MKGGGDEGNRAHLGGRDCVIHGSVCEIEVSVQVKSVLIVRGEIPFGLAVTLLPCSRFFTSDKQATPQGET